MARQSVFREFMAVLRKRWKTEHPFICPLAEARGHMPKASTFDAGIAKPSGVHVFLHFQHSSKSWRVGQFTVNVVLAADELNPRSWGHAERTGDQFAEGPHRIGHLVGSKDKWWHLRQDAEPIGTLAWRPSTYVNPEVVLSEAVEDVTRDVLSALRLLGVPIDSR